MRVKYYVSSPKYGDFLVEKSYTFEVGGASKTQNQIQGIPLAYVTAVRIKYGNQNKISLLIVWIFVLKGGEELRGVFIFLGIS